MEEKEYLRDGATLVTSTRIEIEGQTFAVRNVGSVKVDKGGTPWFAAILIIFGVGLLIQPKAWLAGAVLIAACVAWIWQKVKLRTLVLVTGGGETVALKSTNGAMVERVRDAIAQAISAR